MPAAFSFPIPSHTLPSLSSRQIRPAAPFSSRWIQARSRPARHRRHAPPLLPPSTRAPLPSLSRLLPLPEAATPPPPPPNRRGLSRRRAPRIRLPGPPRAPPPASPRDLPRWAAATPLLPIPPPLVPALSMSLHHCSAAATTMPAMAAASGSAGLSSAPPFRLLASGPAQLRLPHAAACRRRSLLRCAASGGGSGSDPALEEQRRRQAELAARIASGEFTVQGPGLAPPCSCSVPPPSLFASLFLLLHE